MNAKLPVRETSTRAGLALLWTLFIAGSDCPAQSSSSLRADSPDHGAALQSVDHQGIWEHGVGEGFQRGAQSLTLSAGGGYGLAALGGIERHDLALGSVAYGRMLDGPLGRDCWYRGNFELRVDLFGGVQFSPKNEWVVGLTPHLRYNFATGTRWIPYIDGGIGGTLTSIRKPDLGGVFQFNLQAVVGVQRFVTDNIALTVQAGYMHISSAGIYKPNSGVNCVTGMAGISFFF